MLRIQRRGHNDAFGILLKLLRWCRATEMFVGAGVNTL